MRQSSDIPVGRRWCSGTLEGQLASRMVRVMRGGGFPWSQCGSEACLCRVGCLREFGRRQTPSPISSEQEHINHGEICSLHWRCGSSLSSERSWGFQGP